MKRLILMVSMTMLVTGCASVVKGSRQDVEVKTDPPGLTVRIAAKRCISPCTLTDVSRKAKSIIVVKDGRESVYPLDKSYNYWTSCFGNFWNFILPGSIVDSISGAWLDIEPVYIKFGPPFPAEDLFGVN